MRMDTGDAVTAPGRFDDLLDVLQHRTFSMPERVAFTFLDGEGREEERVTFRQLDERARTIAATLQERGFQGKTVLLLYPPGLQYIAALLGSMYAGCIAVPSYPPRPRQLARFAAILTDSGAAAALTTSAIRSVILDKYGEFASAIPIDWVATDGDSPGLPFRRRRHTTASDAIAFLQYTSGSTGQPKGVILTQGILLRNLRGIAEAMGCSSDSVGVFWLPPYHDMGLIGGILAAIYSGVHSILMSPAAFVQQPVRWLEAISRYGATISGGPNFGYELCVDKISERQSAELDLSSWSLAFNGSETARAGTMRRFAERFERCRFRREAFYPCYGLAEATLLVAGGWYDWGALARQRPMALDARNGTARSAAAPATAALSCANMGVDGGADWDLDVAVRCGIGLPGHRVIIVDPRDETECPPGVEGEIWVAGPSVAAGYWNKSAETEATFRAHLEDTNEGPFLRTGDLGYLDDGQLCVSGRIKDLVNLAGRKLHPQDIELSVQRSHPALRKGAGAAFSVAEKGRERLIVVQEVNPRYDGGHAEIISLIRESLAAEHDVMDAEILLVTAGSVPKTSSGKVQRSTCKQYLADATLLDNVVARSDTPTEEVVKRIWAEVLGVENVGIHDDFFSLGGQSLLATQVASRVRDALKIELPLRALFEQPTVAGLAESIERGAAPREAPIGPAPRKGELPLSFAQQRLWFLDQLEPNSPSYNISAAVRLSGDLDVGALGRVLNEVIRRHEALRTAFASVDGRAVQVVGPALTIELPLLDLSEPSGLPEAGREAQVREAATREARGPFDLARGPLLRATLIKLAEQEHVALLTMHHIVSDGWSMGVLVQEVAALYEAFTQGRPSPLAELPIQYADFAHWQREWLQGDRLTEQLAYWKERLREPSVLELPLDRPRPAVQTVNGAIHHFTLPAALTAELRNLGRQQNATLFMTLLAGFKVLLQRHAGQADICVGTPIANRNRAEIEGLIGFFVNTLVLRTDLSGNPTFAELIGRVRETALGAYAHQDLPFERLVEELRPARDLSHTPLVQVMFALRNTPMGELRMPGLTLSALETDSGTARFDLTMQVVDTPDELSCSFEYNTDLFERETIERLEGHLRTILANVVADPSRRIGELEMLSAREREQLLARWNETAAPYPSGTVVDLVEEQAAKRPDAVAVVLEDRWLTYSEVNARANQLARRLCELGVGPERLVGLSMERTPEMVVGVLGILKAGGAYLPLDPSYPRERLAFMLDDARVSVLVTQAQLAERLPVGAAQVVSLDSSPGAEGGQGLAGYSGENLPRQSGPENLAYVIYTSGSTGRPKGVELAHSGLCNLATAQAGAFVVEPGDRVLQISSLSFDASIWELTMALTRGAALHLVRQETLLSAEELASVIEGQGITTVTFPPSLLGTLPEDRLAGTMRTVVVAGEPCSRELLARWAPGRRFFNAYGPSEATVCATIHRCDEREPSSPPIGRPIANTRLYVLDGGMRPLPVGVAGELYVGGAGLARGYRHRPALTAERFVPDPFGGEPGSRLYRTGDRVRYRADGAVEYLGRLDHQVKVRGFRIELGEIEAALARHEAIREVVVVAREDQPGDRRLSAYYVGAGEVAGSELRAFLKQRLPEYMVPAAFVALPAMPLSPNGKVDRKALPAPDRDRAALEVAYAAPRTASEEVLAGIWAQVLGVERVGIHDNFFELGGDSILSIQVIARARQQGLAVTPKQLFEHQTVTTLAAAAGSAEGAVTAEQGVVTGPVPLTPIQAWLFEQELPVPEHFNQSLLLEVKGEVRAGFRADLLRPVMERLLTHHDALRLRFRRGPEGVWQQEEAERETHDVVEVVDVSGLSEVERRAAIEAKGNELQGSLNLTEGPLLRVAYFDHGSGADGRLLIAIHHLAIDGVSWRILLEDLQSGYRALSRGEPMMLPPKTTSFKRWAERLREYAGSQALLGQVSHWTELARGPFAAVPVDHPEGRNTAGSMRRVTVSLGAEETRELLQEVPAVYRTQINDLLLTALSLSLSRWAGGERVLIDLEGHGREDLFEDVDLSRTVGWFTSLFPVALDTGQAKEPGAAIKSVKEQLRRIPEKGIGYGILRYLQPAEVAEALRAVPRAAVSFNYLGQTDGISSGGFALAKESGGRERSERGERRYLLDVNAIVADGQLLVTWAYSEEVHERATVEAVAGSFVAELRALVAHCLSPEAGGYTPSDFPLAGLDQATIDKLFGDKLQPR
jgi:amino acid adenylation domain-containing protein/non-ribosomal peptide synthase protein (TIGR01720 family)